MTRLGELFRSRCTFVAGISVPEQIPKNHVPEVAFIGRSNVGKSSLINALVRQKDCARVSKTPGRTQQINFFTIADKITLVDLPGYGYAAISHSTRKAWDNLILHYLEKRQNLRRVFLLLDSRHGIKKNDEEIMQILDAAAVTYQILLTKIDKISDTSTIVHKLTTQIVHNAAAHPIIIATSTAKSVGIREVQMEILKFV